MDPSTALAALRDETLPVDERYGAGLDLAGWLQNGGYVPAGLFTPYGLSYGGHNAAHRAARRIVAEEMAALPHALEEM